MQLVGSSVRASHALQEHLSILFSQKGKHIIKASTSHNVFRVTFHEFGGVGVGVMLFDLCGCIYKILRIPQAFTILP